MLPHEDTLYLSGAIGVQRASWPTPQAVQSVYSTKWSKKVNLHPPPFTLQILKMMRSICAWILEWLIDWNTMSASKEIVPALSSIYLSSYLLQEAYINTNLECLLPALLKLKCKQSTTIKCYFVCPDLGAPPQEKILMVGNKIKMFASLISNSCTVPYVVHANF